MLPAPSLILAPLTQKKLHLVSQGRGYSKSNMPCKAEMTVAQAIICPSELSHAFDFLLHSKHSRNVRILSSSSLEYHFHRQMQMLSEKAGAYLFTFQEIERIPVWLEHSEGKKSGRRHIRKKSSDQMMPDRGSYGERMHFIRT